MSKVNRFMSPVQTQYQQTYVNQYVPLPFELMQKKADRKQKKFDEVSSYADALVGKMKAKVDIKDQPMNQAEIHGLHDQINNALDQVNGDYSKIGGLVKNVAKEFDLYINTDEGYLAQQNKIGIDTNLKEIQDSNMSDLDKQVANEVGVGAYRAGNGAIGNESFVPSTVYDNSSEWQTLALSAVKGRVKDKTAKANVGYIQDGKLLFDSKSTHGYLSKEDIKDITKGIVYEDTKWLNKTEWQFKNYKKTGRIDQETKIGDYRKSVFEKTMEESLTGMSYDQYDEDKNAKETKLGTLEGEEKYYDKFSLNLGGEYNAIKDSDEVNSLASAEGDAVQYLNNKTSATIAGTNKTMAAKLNMPITDFNDLIVELGYGSFTEQEGGSKVANISDAQRIDFYNAILDPDFDTDLIHKVPEKVAELQVQADAALKKVERNDLIQLQALKNFVGKNYTEDEYNIFKATSENRIKGQRHARSVATDPNSTKKEKENAYEIIKLLKGKDMAESYKKFKNTFKDDPKASLWDMYWDIPGIGDTPGSSKKEKITDNEDVYLRSVAKSERLLKSKELGFEISDNAKKRRDSAIKQGWKSQIPLLGVDGKYDPVASKNYAITVNRNLKQSLPQVLNLKVARPNSDGMILFKDALRKDAKEQADGNPDTEEKIYQSYLKDFENTGSVNNPKTMPFKFSTTDPNVFIYGNYELNTDNALDMSTMGEIPLSTKSVMKENQILTKARLDPLDETDLSSTIKIRTGSHSRKKGDDINSKNETNTGENYDIVITLPGGDEYILPTISENGGRSQRDKFMKLYAELTTRMENGIDYDKNKNALELLLKDPLNIIK